MNDVVPHDIEEFARLVGPDRDPIVAEMDAYAEETGFPTVGPAVGGWLRLLARLADADRVFEFGSGYGYSAYWFATANDRVEVVCCEYDADNVERGREYMARGGVADRVTFEQGDAIETVERYDGPFDVVLVDNEKHRYAEAFEAVREKVAPGGLVCADNALYAGDLIEFDALLEIARRAGDLGPGDGGPDPDDPGDADGGPGAVETTEETRGFARYLETVAADTAFETVLLPVGEGVTVSRKTTDA